MIEEDRNSSKSEGGLDAGEEFVLVSPKTDGFHRMIH